MICPIQSMRWKEASNVSCDKERCAWYDKNMDCCCIKTIAENIDDLVKGQRTIYIREI